MDYVGLGMYREWKKIEFPPKGIKYEFGNNKAERSRSRNRWQDEVRKNERLAGAIGWGERVHNREKRKKLLRTATNRRILHMPMNE